MILQHVVLFRFPSQLTVEDDQAMSGMIWRWREEIGLMRKLHFGSDIAGARTQGYQYLLLMEFDGMESLTRYRAHPAHLEFGEWIHARNCTVLAFDYYLDETTVVSETTIPQRDANPEVLVSSYYRYVDSGDVDGLISLYAADCTYDRPGYESMTGLSELREFYTSERSIAQGKHVIRRVLTSGSTAAVEGDFRGELKSGASVAAKFADLFDVQDKKIHRRRTYFFAPLI